MTTPRRKAIQKLKRRLRTREGLREYSYLGCALTRNRSAWCFRICTPDEGGKGVCGRLAPHSLRSRIQQGITDYKRRQLAEHWAKLERMYLAAPCNDHYRPGISISEGEAEVVVPVQKSFHHAAGSVHGSVYFKAMDDAAFFAVNSLIEDVFVLTVNFNVYLTKPVKSGEIIARGRFVGRSGRNYLAEAVLVDGQGEEIGRGNGAFVQSKIHLTPKLGYA